MQFCHPFPSHWNLTLISLLLLASISSAQLQSSQACTRRIRIVLHSSGYPVVITDAQNPSAVIISATPAVSHATGIVTLSGATRVRAPSLLASHVFRLRSGVFTSLPALPCRFFLGVSLKSSAAEAASFSSDAPCLPAVSGTAGSASAALEFACALPSCPPSPLGSPYIVTVTSGIALPSSDPTHPCPVLSVNTSSLFLTIIPPPTISHVTPPQAPPSSIITARGANFAGSCAAWTTHAVSGKASRASACKILSAGEAGEFAAAKNNISE